MIFGNGTSPIALATVFFGSGVQDGQFLLYAGRPIGLSTVKCNVGAVFHESAAGHRDLWLPRPFSAFSKPALGLHHIGQALDRTG